MKLDKHKIFLIIIKICIFVFAVNVEAKSKVNRAPKANAGENIDALSGSTIMLDGRKSRDPDGGRLLYTWTLPASFMMKKNYTYDKTDTVSVHKTDNKNKSINTIKTYTKKIKVDLPNSDMAATYVISLKVTDKKGLSNSDDLIVKLIPDTTKLDTIVQTADGLKAENSSMETLKKNSISSERVSIEPLAGSFFSASEVDIINNVIAEQLKSEGMFGLLPPVNKRILLSNSNSGINYNFNCKTDSCAAKNGVYNKTKYTLTWTVKDNSIILRFFNGRDLLSQKPTYSWDIIKLPLSGTESNKIEFPTQLFIHDRGDIFITNPNKHTVLKLDKNQIISEYISGDIYGLPLSNAAGYAQADGSGMYISDKDNNRIFKEINGKYRSVADKSTNILADKSLGEMTLNSPSILRKKKDGTLLILYEGDQSIMSLSDDGDLIPVLNPGIVSGISDFALDANESIYICSFLENQIFIVIDDKTVKPIAGLVGNEGLMVEGAPANKSFLFKPYSIDFDQSGNLFIAEKGSGKVRFIDNQGRLFTVSGGGKSEVDSIYLSAKKVNLPSINSLRIDNSNNIYLLDALQHSIYKLSLNKRRNWIASSMIFAPMKAISTEGVISIQNRIQNSISEVINRPKSKSINAFSQKFKKIKKSIYDYFDERPAIYTFFILLTSHYISDFFDDGDVGTPPSFPFSK